MISKPTTALRSECLYISAMAKGTGETINITNKGEADDALTSEKAVVQREKMLTHRTSILEAELSRLVGASTYSLEDVRAHLEEKYQNG